MAIRATTSDKNMRAADAGRRPNAITDVMAERTRQIQAEGWTPQHDDEHAVGEMAIAAGCYAIFAAESDGFRRSSADTTCPENWPWHPKWWKPKTRRQDLVRAAALIIAEIERLDRASTLITKTKGL